MPNHNEAGNGLERSRDTNLSFLVWKYFTSPLFLFLPFVFSFASLVEWASLLAFGKRQGNGYEKYPLLYVCSSFSHVFFLLRRRYSRSSDFVLFLLSFFLQVFYVFHLALQVPC